MKNYIFIIPFIAFFLVGCTLLPANENATTVQPADQPSTTIIEENPSNTVPSVINIDGGYQDVEIDFRYPLFQHISNSVLGITLPNDWDYTVTKWEDEMGTDDLQIIINDPESVTTLYLEQRHFYTGPIEVQDFPNDYTVMQRKVTNNRANQPILIRATRPENEFRYIDTWEVEGNLDLGSADYSISYFLTDSWEDFTNFFTYVKTEVPFENNDERLHTIDTIIESIHIKDHTLTQEELK